MSDTDTNASYSEQGTDAAWRAAVEKALKGASFDSLASQSSDGLRIAPLYGAEFAPRTEPVARSAAPLDMRGLCAEASPEAANGIILGDLQGGATSMSLQIEAPGQSGLVPETRTLDAALDGVDLRLAHIWLAPGEAFESGAAALDTVWRDAGLADQEARGGYGADPIGALARTGGLDRSIGQSLDAMAALAGRTFRTRPNVRAVTVDASLYHDAGASEADEIACMAATFIACLHAMEESRLSPAEAFSTTAFTLAADADFLLTIAKLRAARLVLGRIAEETEAGALPVWLQAISSRRMMTRYDPYTNILRMTIAEAAAILGGADAVIVRPHTALSGQPDAFASRIARNIPIVLQEEAHLARVADPAAGSFALEALTGELAEKAWERMRAIESAGGMAAALQSGMVQSRIRETAERRAHDVATGKFEIVGVNTFASADETAGPAPVPLPPALDDPAVTAEPLPLRRDVEGFERLRDASAAYLAHTGVRPAVMLATLGRPKDYAARAAFAENFFAAGGITVSTPGPIATATGASASLRESEAKIVILCSSDEVYQGLAIPAAEAMNRAGAQFVLLVGRPGERRETYRAAGIGGFIHKGCDQIAMLSDILNRLGARMSA